MPKKKKAKKKVKKILVKKTKVLKDNKIEKKSLKLGNKNTYTPEVKIEIKKIKKQPTEKRIYDIKDFVVYPKHGVGKITAVEKKTKISKIKKTQSGSAKPFNKNTYTPEEKIEIKKIKKQPTEKKYIILKIL